MIAYWFEFVCLRSGKQIAFRLRVPMLTLLASDLAQSAEIISEIRDCYETGLEKDGRSECSRYVVRRSPVLNPLERLARDRGARELF